MKNKLPCKVLLVFFFQFILIYGSVSAQTTKENLTKTILFYDSAFWQTYNTCDVKNMGKYFTDDLEFYHDKGGFSTGLNAFLEKTKKNLCGKENWRLKREAVPGSLVVFPLANNDTIYGAILTGEHVFYVIENNNPPRLDGKAAFTHVWIVKNNVWKMSRILSYDHGPADRPAEEVMITVAAATLDLYAGNYTAAKTGKLTVQRLEDHLLLSVGNQKFEIFPQTENKFFFKGRDLFFEFTKGTDGKIEKMIVWENGKIAEEALRDK